MRKKLVINNTCYMINWGLEISKKEIDYRLETLDLVRLIFEQGMTLKDASYKMNMSQTTASNRIKKYLPEMSKKMYKEFQDTMERNRRHKYIKKED